MFFFDQINQFFERYKRLNDYKPSALEELADVDQFKKYGAKITIKSLCDKFHKTMGEVLAMRAEEVYEYLLIDFEEHQYAKRLDQASKHINK
jgi:hypothetical protein